MNQEAHYSRLLSCLDKGLVFLEDKPEETAQSTLMALWFLAAGKPLSAEGALAQSNLPLLDDAAISHLNGLIDRRLQGEPLAHITGRQQFMGIELLAGPQALVPRKETEILGRRAIEIIQALAQTQREVCVIDVCTGAGNLPAAYATHEPKAQVYAADLSAEAVSLAQRNVDFLDLTNRVHLRVGDLLTPFDTPEYHSRIDVLTCNPPYISSKKLEAMHHEIIGFEPRLAFDGGAFGIKIVQNLLQEAPKYLKSGGYLLFEIGLGQGELLANRMAKQGIYRDVQPLYDPAGHVRAICARVS